MVSFDWSSVLPTNIFGPNCLMIVDNAAGHARRLGIVRPAMDRTRFLVGTKQSCPVISPVPGNSKRRSMNQSYSPTSLEEEFRRLYIGKLPQPQLNSPMQIKFQVSPATSQRNAPKPVRQASVENLQYNQITVDDASMVEFKKSSAAPNKATVAALQRSLPTILL